MASVMGTRLPGRQRGSCDPATCSQRWTRRKAASGLSSTAFSSAGHKQPRRSIAAWKLARDPGGAPLQRSPGSQPLGRKSTSDGYIFSDLRRRDKKE